MASTTETTPTSAGSSGARGYLVKWDWWAFPGVWAFDADVGTEGALADDAPLSDDLLGQLSRWVSDGDVQGRGDATAIDDELIDWNRRGRSLAARVRAEVPDDIPVWWFDELTGERHPVPSPDRR